MKNNLLMLLLLFISGVTYAQTNHHLFFYSKYDWKTNPDAYELTKEELALDEVMVKDKRCIQLVQDNDDLYEYNLTHKIIRLNTDKAIEKNNKYYVSNYNTLKVVTQKARVIKPNGKIIELSEKDIKVSKDEDGNIEYQYFAFEGIELGSTIEYLDIMVYPPKLSGATIPFQSSVLKKNVEVEVITPSHIEYELYCINGLKKFEEVKEPTLGIRHMKLTLDKLEPLAEEDWSAYGANLQKCYYKFQKNTATNKANFYNYGTVAQNIHSNMFAEMTKKEKSAVKKFIESVNLEANAGTEDKVRRLENAMKKRIAVVDADFEQSSDLAFVLTKNVTTEDGINKLMINCLRELGIECELVITCDRNDNKFLKDFEGYNFLQEYLIYIKEIDKYFSASILHRTGFPPEEYTYCDGLFISEVKIGDMVTAVGKIKHIKGTTSAQSVDEIRTRVSFAEDFASTNVKLERTTTGYKALPYQALLDLLDEERRTELKNDYLQYLDPETKLEDAKFKNDESALLGAMPFIGNAMINSTNFVEKGGENYLFKVGMMIGPQSELYNKETRKLPVETPYARKYIRTIEVTIPEGYTLKNAESLNMDVTPDDSANTIGFTSSYKIEGNILTIDVAEWYDLNYYPLEAYKQYEQVINAAADFNKIVIVFQKK